MRRFAISFVVAVVFGVGWFAAGLDQAKAQVFTYRASPTYYGSYYGVYSPGIAYPYYSYYPGYSYYSYYPRYYSYYPRYTYAYPGYTYGYYGYPANRYYRWSYAWPRYRPYRTAMAPWYVY